MNIASIDAYQIYDSRGVPTIETEVVLADGTTGIGVAPSGASTGQYEALELRDGDRQQFRGKSVFKAISHVQGEIAKAVVGRDVTDQAGIDQAMIDLDGTPAKSRLGANAVLSVSMAVARAAAAHRGLPLFASLGDGTTLPLPEIQIVGGGAHANWRTDVQDFLLIVNGATSYEQVMRVTHDVFHAAGDLMRERGTYFGVADEGGVWPDVRTNAEAIELVVQAIERAGYVPGRDASISLDVAASDLFDGGANAYRLRLEGRHLSAEQFAEMVTGWCRDYPIVSVEDPLRDADFDGWAALNRDLGSRVQLVGDDLFTTNPARIRRGIELDLANAVLIKLNQIGTVTETLAAIRLTQAAGWRPIVSARSGETEDAFISHLAVATDAGQLKVGSFSRSERMVKWNEVLRIARHLGDRATFAGPAVLRPATRPRLPVFSAVDPVEAGKAPKMVKPVFE